MTEPAVDPQAASGISPTSGVGLGPHVITVAGTGLLTTPNGSKIVMKDASGDTVGTSALGTATATAFTKSVMFDTFTPSGNYTAWLVQNNIASQVPGTPFTLTRYAPPLLGPALPGYGVFERGFGIPNYRGR